MPQRHPLTRIERSFWLGSLVGTSPNNTSFSFLLPTTVDLSILQQAIEAFVAENPLCHAHVELQPDNSPCWVIDDVPTDIVTHAELPPTATSTTLNHLIDSFSQQPFDLTCQPPCRFRLFKSRGQSNCLTAVFHHAVSDPDSTDLFCKRLSDIYNALRHNTTPTPSHSRILDYAAMEQRPYLSPNAKADRDYWNAYANSHVPTLIASFFPTQIAAGHISSHRFRLPAADISQACQRLATSPFRLLAAAWAVTVAKALNLDGLYLNYTVSLRPKELADTFGSFVNNLLLYVDTANADTTFQALVEAVSHDRRHAQPRQYMSMLNTDVHTILRSPTSTAGFNYPLRQRQNKLTLDDSQQALYRRPLTHMPSSLQLDIEQDCDLAILYTDATYPSFYADMLAESFVSVVSQVAAQPSLKLGQITLLPPDEPLPASIVANDSQPLADLFRQTASSLAHQPACYFGGEHLTYGQLDQLSDRVASLIADSHPTTPFVGVYCHRSLYTIAMLIGVWKAGHAYIPLDPDYSRQRLQQIIDDSHPSLIVADNDEARRLASGCQWLVIDLQQLAATTITPAATTITPAATTITPAATVPGGFAAGSPIPSPHKPPTATPYAYMIYTSGTTGQPKGTPITQRALANLVAARQHYIPTSQNSLELSYASIAFDASVWDIFPPLLTGTPIYMASKEERQDPELLLQTLEQRQISCACIPPAMLAFMPYRWLPSLQFLVVAGEACPPEVIKLWQQTTTVINAYGPTENTVCTTMHVYDHNDIANNIGLALEGVSCYVLSPQLQRLPTGVKGQLYIGGVQLTKGYYERPWLNAEHFLPNPFATEQERAAGVNLTLYATGDMVYRLPDDSLVFCGRADTQVKVNGFRIELSEVAHALEHCAGVEAAVVLAVGKHPTERRLVAWVLSTQDEQPLPDTLRGQLANKLPPYMVPVQIVVTNAFPLTNNGKVDHQQLVAQLTTTTSTASDSLAAENSPLTPTAKTIEGLWREVLNFKGPLTPTAHFFTIGGSSLDVVRLAQRLSQKLSIEISISQLYQHLQLNSMATFVDQLHQLDATVPGASAAGSRHDRSVPGGISAGRSAPQAPQATTLTHLHGLLTACLLSPKRSLAYHVLALVNIPQHCTDAQVLDAWNKMLLRHDALRLAFPVDNNGNAQPVFQSYEPLKSLPKVDVYSQTQLNSAISQQLQQPFALHSGPLYHVCLYRLGNQATLSVAMHHLVTDGWSVSLLKQQMEGLLASSVPGGFAAGSAYADYLAQRYSQQQLDSYSHYWQQHLKGVSNLGIVKNNVQPGPAKTIETQLPTIQAQVVAAFCEKQQLTLFATLLTAFMATLATVARQRHFAVGYASSGRNDQRFNDTLGFFVHTLPCPCPPTIDSSDFATTTHSVMQQVADEQSHLLPLSMLVRLAGQQVYANATHPLIQALITLESPMPESDFMQDTIALFPIVMRVVSHTSGELRCQLTYDTHAVSNDTASELATTFVRLLANPDNWPATVSTVPGGVADGSRTARPVPGSISAGSSTPSALAPHRLLPLQRLVASITGADPASITPTANLFTELGLTSTEALQLAYQASRQHYSVSVSDIYTHPTLQELAAIGSASLSWWHQPFQPEKPTVVLVCGRTPARPFYDGYASSLSQRYNVYVVEGYTAFHTQTHEAGPLTAQRVSTLYKENLNAIGTYVDTIEARVSSELLAHDIKPIAITGHSIGARCALMLAQRLSLGLPQLQVVCVAPSFPWPGDIPTAPSTTLAFHNSKTSSNIAFVLETLPSDTLMPGGPTVEGVRQLTATFIDQRRQLIAQQYPQARVIELQTDHFGVFQPSHLPTIASIFAEEPATTVSSAIPAAKPSASTVPGGFAAAKPSAPTVPGGFAAAKPSAPTVPGGFAAGKSTPQPPSSHQSQESPNVQ